MIITEPVPVTTDNSDAASTNTLVTDEDRLPRFFAPLTYASLVLSVLPFTFSLIVVSLSRVNSVPTILAYVLTTPFHVAALLIIWEHSRQIDMQLPFKPSSWRSLGYTCCTLGAWIASIATCGMGARTFVKRQYCNWSNSPLPLPPCDPHHFDRTISLLLASTVFAILETFILAAILVVSYRNRSRKPETSRPPTPPATATTPTPKVLSA